MSSAGENWETADLPFDLRGIEKEYGSIEQAELICPGIYYLRTVPPENPQTSVWIYVATEDAPITREARRYGKTLPECPELRLFACEGWDFHWMVIEYEILRYRTKKKLPQGEFESLQSAAAFGMEVCPAYFGTYPVPILTPWGYTTRHKTIHNGVYWIETDQAVSVLAVCYVIQDDFSKTVLGLAKLNEYDREHGLDNTMGYSFFHEDDSCLPLLELMRDHGWWNWSMIDKPALMNAVWTRFPEYAAAQNIREQWGENDGLVRMLRALGIVRKFWNSPADLVALTPEAGIQFLKFT